MKFGAQFLVKLILEVFLKGKQFIKKANDCLAKSELKSSMVKNSDEFDCKKQ